MDKLTFLQICARRMTKGKFNAEFEKLRKKNKRQRIKYVNGLLTSKENVFPTSGKHQI